MVLCKVTQTSHFYTSFWRLFVMKMPSTSLVVLDHNYLIHLLYGTRAYYTKTFNTLKLRYHSPIRLRLQKSLHALWDYMKKVKLTYEAEPSEI